MPRDGSGIYHTLAGTDGVPNTTIASSPYNANVHDVETDLNTPRPIVAGGTGSSTASGALANLGAVAKSGDTMTGNLIFNSAQPKIVMNSSANGALNEIDGWRNNSARWGLQLGDGTAETGGNTGSNFNLYGCNDDNTPWAAVHIDRPTKKISLYQNVDIGGTLDLLGPIKMDSAIPKIIMNSSFNGAMNEIDGWRNNNARWALLLGNATAESGGNSGSDFHLYGYDDSGTAWNAININRQTRKTTLYQNVDVQGVLNPSGGVRVDAAVSRIVLNSSSNGATNEINGWRSGAARWNLQLGDGTAEGGSSSGSNYHLYGYDDSGTAWHVMDVNRQTTKITLYQATDITANLNLTSATYSYKINNIPVISSDGIASTLLWDMAGVPCMYITSDGTTTYANNVHKFYSRSAGTFWMQIDTFGIYPHTDNALLNGGPSNRWSAVYSAGGVITSSDARTKSDFRPIDNVLDRTLAVPVASFNVYDRATVKNGHITLGDSKKRSLGVTAQQIRQLFPEFGDTIASGDALNGILGLNEAKVAMLTLAAFQEYVRKTDARIAELEAQVKGTP